MRVATANEAWWIELNRLLSAPEINPRRIATRELIAEQATVAMLQPVVSHPGRKLNYKFMAAEAAWIIRGSSDVRELTPYVGRMAEFSDDGIRLQGAYGPMFVEQVRYVSDALFHDMMTRQAVMTLWRPNPRQSKDVPCTISLQFLIRGVELHCVATMRSSDIWLGWPYDVFSFSMISAYVILHLMRRNPQMFAMLRLGNLILTTGSQHLYVTDLLKADACARRGIVGDNLAIDLSDLEHPDHLLQCLDDIRNCRNNPLIPDLHHHDNGHTNITRTGETAHNANVR